MNNYPILAAQNTWWKPNVSTVKSSSITEIEFMDSYTPDSSVTVVDSWDASAAQDGNITCYVIGMKLIVAGNGSGKIAANEDSYRCFRPTDKFTSVTKFTSLDLLEIGNANISQMFNSCSALTSIDLSGWDVSNVTNMSGLFALCSNLLAIDLHSWDVSNVTKMDMMFMYCQKLTSVVGLSEWNVSNVTDMSYMFSSCLKLVTVDNLTNWNVSNVTNMEMMFGACEELTSIGNIAEWNTSKVTSMTAMFEVCEKLESIGDISNWDTSRVTNMKHMFSGCSNLSGIGDLSNWNVSNVTDLQQMFNGCSNLADIGDISNWDVSSVETMRCMFQECSKLTGIGDLSNWDVSNVTNMSFMFYGCSSIGEIDVSKWNTAKLTNLDHFAAHAGLRRKGIENWNTSSLINANAAFHNCAEEELDLSGWDVSKVQFFCQMFENSPNLKRIKGLENWNTSAGLGFDGMFERCYVLEELDLSSFDTSKAKNGVEGSTNGHKTATLNNMFLSCNNLRKVTLGSNFAVNGDGTNTTAANKLILPTPSTDYIEGADGMWYTFNGDAYAPDAVKDRTYNIYYASKNLIHDLSVRVNNGTILDIVKAIREKVPNLEPTLLSDLDDVISSKVFEPVLEVDEEGNAIITAIALSIDEEGKATIIV